MREDDAEIEARLAALLDAGDTSAAATLLLRGYGRPVAGYLVSLLRSEEAASEVYSIFSEDVWSGIPRFERRCPARVWALTVARHAAVRFVLARKRRERRELLFSRIPLGIEPPLAERTPTPMYRRSEAAARVSALRAALNRRDRELLTLRVDQRLAFKDIAQITRPAAKSEELSREAARLRKRYQLVKAQLAAALA
jgi:RNA polymerase sigma-70 factor (ECF subfamily)